MDVFLLLVYLGVGEDRRSKVHHLLQTLVYVRWPCLRTFLRGRCQMADTRGGLLYGLHLHHPVVRVLLRSFSESSRQVRLLSRECRAPRVEPFTFCSFRS